MLDGQSVSDPLPEQIRPRRHGDTSARDAHVGPTHSEFVAPLQVCGRTRKRKNVGSATAADSGPGKRYLNALVEQPQRVDRHACYGHVELEVDGRQCLSKGRAGGDSVALPARAITLGPVDSTWDVAVDALMLWQGNGQSLPLFLNSSGGVALDAQDLQTQTGAGVRIGAIRQVGETHAIEGNYFQARPFDAMIRTPATGEPFELVNAGDLPPWGDIATAAVTTGGSIQSAEINWRKQESWSPITWLVGFRWVELDSQSKVDYLFSSTGGGDIATDAGNNLYGGQFGADMLFWNAGGRWRVNGVGKAGIFYNSVAYQRSSAGLTLQDGSTVPIGSTSATADQTSFFGEAGLNATWWATNWLAWRVGYSVFWAGGVAVATDQIPLNNYGDGTASINTNGSVLLHGMTTGIEARW